MFWDVSKSNKTDDILIARFSIDEQKNQTPLFQPQHYQITSLVYSRCGSIITCATVKGMIISFDISKVSSILGFASILSDSRYVLIMKTMKLL